MVTVELESAARAEFGSVDDTPIRWGIINTTVRSWRDNERQSQTKKSLVPFGIQKENFFRVGGMIHPHITTK